MFANDRLRRIFIAAALLGLVGGWLVLRREHATAPSGDHPGSAVVHGNTGSLKASHDLAPIPLELDADPRGSLSLIGQVVDETGAPCPGAQLAIDSAPPRTLDAEADGSFAIQDLAPRTYAIVARRGDAIAGPVVVRLAADTAPVELRLVRAGALEVTVSDAATRQPVAGAAVELRGDATSALPPAAVSDARGVAVLHGVAAGSYAVRAAADGYAPALIAYQAVEQAMGARATARLAVALRGGITVGGTVIDPAGQPVAGASVIAEDAAQLAPHSDERDGARSDDHGRWQLRLVPGSYRFVARRAGAAPGTTAVIALAAARDDLAITVDPGATLAGRVVTTSDAPVPFATVRAVVDEGSWGSAVARQVTADAHGGFALRGLPRRRVQVVALGESATSATRAIDLAQPTGEVVLALDAIGSIAGAVQDPGGAPVPGALVTADPATPAARGRAELTLRGALVTVADDHGRFTLGGLPAGKYLLRASWPGARRRTSSLRPAVAASTGDLQVALSLAADASVRGHVQGDDGRVPEIFTVTLGGGAVFGGAGGQFAITGVPSGRHTMTIAGPDFATRTISDLELAPGEARDLGAIAVIAGRRISGRVLGADGAPIAGATVAVTKQIAGVVAGPGGAVISDLKQTTSGDDGSYRLAGLTQIELAIGASDPIAGKSPLRRVPAGTQDQVIDLTLAPTGALHGTITRDHVPASGAVVVLSARGATSGGTGATTGTDGSFQLDALTPGSYSLVAMFDGGGGQQLKQAQVAIAAGKVAQLDIDLPRGQATLVVSAAPAAPNTADSARVFLTERGAAGNGRAELVARTAPARFTELTPGSYQLCVAAIAAKPGAELPAPVCSYLTITEAPEQQATVQLPASGPT